MDTTEEVLIPGRVAAGPEVWGAILGSGEAADGTWLNDHGFAPDGITSPQVYADEWRRVLTAAQEA